MDILMKWHVPSACLPCFLSSLIAALATLVLSFPSLCLSLIDQFLLFLNLYLCPRCLRLIASILLYCFWVKCWFLCKAHGNLLCWSVCCRSKRNSILCVFDVGASISMSTWGWHRHRCQSSDKRNMTKRHLNTLPTIILILYLIYYIQCIYI